MTERKENKSSILCVFLKILHLLIRCVVVVVDRGLRCSLWCYGNTNDDTKARTHIEEELISIVTQIQRTSTFTKRERSKSRGYQYCCHSQLRPPVNELKFKKDEMWRHNQKSTVTHSPTQLDHSAGKGYFPAGFKNHSPISFSPEWKERSSKIRNGVKRLPKRRSCILYSIESNEDLTVSNNPFINAEVEVLTKMMEKLDINSEKHQECFSQKKAAVNLVDKGILRKYKKQEVKTENKSCYERIMYSAKKSESLAKKKLTMKPLKKSVRFKDVTEE